MVLNINFPKNFSNEVKILYFIKKSKLLLKGYGCHNPNSEKCRNCPLQGFKKGSLLDIDIDEVKNNKGTGCAEMSNLFFSLQFEVGNIEGIRIS
jgi:hypothetical protein